MRWRESLPDDIRLAIERFHENQVTPMRDRDVHTLALRQYLTSLGYLEAEDVAQPHKDVVEDTLTEGSA